MEHYVNIGVPEVEVESGGVKERETETYIEIDAGLEGEVKSFMTELRVTAKRYGITVMELLELLDNVEV